MMVTAIKPRQKDKKKVGLFLDGKFVMDLSPDILTEAGICAGKEITSSELKKLKKTELGQRALERAHRYLASRPRSESEVRARLERYGYDNDVVTSTIRKLEKSGYIDDVAFAQYWMRNRASFNSRGSRLLAVELKQKGVDSEIVTDVVESVDDDAEAYRAGYKKARLLRTGDYYEFRKKMWSFLNRRGFDYEVINRIVEKLWQEKLSEGENG